MLWIAPFGGVYLVDMLLRRGRCDVEALYATSGRCWFRKGYDLHAPGSFLAGVVGAAMFSSNAAFDGPLVASIGGGDISIFVGLIVGDLVTMCGRLEAIPDSTVPVQRPAKGAAGGVRPSQVSGHDVNGNR